MKIIGLVLVLAGGGAAAAMSGPVEARSMPRSSAAQMAVGVRCIAADVTEQPWAEWLLEDEKDTVELPPVVSIITSEPQVPCSTTSGQEDCHGATTTFFSVKSDSCDPETAFCSANATDTAGDVSCYSTGTMTGLTMSCSKNTGDLDGFICTSSNTGTGAGGTVFCGITTTGIASTWHTKDSGLQMCSVLQTAPAQNPGNKATCTAKAGATGWCSVDQSQEHNAECTAMGGDGTTCSTIGGGTSRCSARTPDGSTILPPATSGPDKGMCKAD